MLGRGRHRAGLTPASPRQALQGGALAVLLAVALSLLLAALRAHLTTANIALLYLLPVLTGATIGGLIPGVLAAVLCAVTFDLLFIRPYGVLTVGSGEDLLTLGLYGAVGALAAELAARARARADEAARRAAFNALLYDLSSVFLAGDLDGALAVLVERIGAAFALLSCDILLPGAEEVLRSRAHWGTESAPRTGDERRVATVAAWTYARGGTVDLVRARPAASAYPATTGQAGAASPAERGSDDAMLFFPLRIAQPRGEARPMGVLALMRPAGTPLTDDETRLLETLAAQVALLVDRARLAEDAAQAAVLRESDRVKSILLANVSHELRTPLTTIRGAAESLLATDMQLDAPTRAELMAGIRDDADRLAALVGNLLSLSRLEADSQRPDRHLYDLAEIAAGAVIRLQPQLARHAVQTDLAEDVPPVLVDYTLIDQVVVNLLDNAARYAPAGTTITLRLRQDGDRALLSVADQGPGIPAAERERVFERFVRLPMAEGSRAPGSGLGLAICRAVALVHDGRIWVEDTGQQGTTVTLALPIPTAHGEGDGAIF